MTTESPTTVTLTPEQSALLWDALASHMMSPLFAHEKEQTRALRDLIASGRVTVTPYP